MISPSGLTWRDSHGSSLTTTLSPVRAAGRFAGLHVNVVDDARIVRHDVEKILRLLQRADDRVVGALQNPNDAAFRAIAPAFARA
jgi:hypothetical protein